MGRAFRDNPLTRAVVGADPERRLRSTTRGMALQLRQFVEHGQAVGARRQGRLVGVRLTVPAGYWPLPASPWLGRFWLGVRQGPRVTRRWAEIGEALEAEHPLGGHAYLSILGVDPPAQGKGIGRGLLEDWVRVLDAEGDFAWLETDQDHCVPFYASVGFLHRTTLEPLGTQVHLMERPGARRGRS